MLKPRNCNSINETPRRNFKETYDGCNISEIGKDGVLSLIDKIMMPPMIKKLCIDDDHDDGSETIPKSKIQLSSSTPTTKFSKSSTIITNPSNKQEQQQCTPTNPIPFDDPIMYRGRRDDVLVLVPLNDENDDDIDMSEQHRQRQRRNPKMKEVIARDVLYRDHSVSRGRQHNGCEMIPGQRPTLQRRYRQYIHQKEEAYWPIEGKEKIKTIMGHIEICHVLVKKRHDHDNSDSEGDEYVSDDDSEMDDEEYGADSENGEVLFEWTGRKVAVKVNYARRIKRYKGRHSEDALKEISAMQLLSNECDDDDIEISGNSGISSSSKHVIGIIDTIFDGTNLNVVLPYMGNGDLFDRLSEQQINGTRFTECDAKRYFRQIIDGARYLHKVKGISHRDLSPENIMFNDQNEAVIIDMGMAIRIPYSPTDRQIGTEPSPPRRTGDILFDYECYDDNKNVTDIKNGTTKRLILPQGACGKLPYMSPEIYQNRLPFDGELIDIWSIGVILFCMVTGNRSYERPQNSDPLYYWMTHNLHHLLQQWNILDVLSKGCLDLLQRILQPNPNRRISLDEILDHPWLNDLL